MQYTYEEAVRELSDFLGKHVTADNFWKMEQVMLTVLQGTEEAEGEYENGLSDGYSNGYDEALRYLDKEADEAYNKGCEDGKQEASGDIDQAFQDGYEQGYAAALRENGECY